MDEDSAILCDKEAMFRIKEIMDLGYDAEDIYICATYLEFEDEAANEEE